jgi:hypothetical protein
VADLTDIQDALATLIESAVYPNGTTAASVINADVAIFPGWPSPEELDADLAAGKANVSIYSQPGVERNTSRFPREYQQQSAVVHTLTALVTNNIVGIGGANASNAPAQWVTVAIGDVGQEKFYSYGVTPGQALAAIATGLAALIAADVPASAAGPVITIATGKPVAARVGSTAPFWRELRRQQRGFQITLWCASPAQRTQLAKAIDPVLAATDRLALADGSGAHMVYASSHESDEAQKSAIFRRDIFYQIEFATSDTDTGFEVTGPFVASVTPMQS